MAKEASNGKQLLDSEELLHLAMAAINAEQHPQAMALLKQGRQQDPDNALLLYLLAAEYAQVGMFDRAMAGMEAALALEPDLQMARLQLGLLYTARDRLTDARPLFERLRELSAEDALHWFGTGLLALLDEKPEDCRTALEKGISLNQSNPSLSADMQRILMQLWQDASPPAAQGTGDKAQAKAQSAANNLYLSRYGSNKSEG